MIKRKNYNTERMVKLFKREFVYRLIKEIHSEKMVSGNQTFVESFVLKYKQLIDNDIVKSI